MKFRGAKALRCWGVLWRSDNSLDGSTRRLMLDCGVPLTFRTRRAAREFIQKRWGYIASRPDLRAEPHGWRMPEARKVEIQLIKRAR